MVMLVAEPHLEEQLRLQRQESGADRFDEVWEGVYFVSPIPNIEHQLLVGRLCTIFQLVVDAADGGMVLPGVNVSDREDAWTHNYRGPDVAVVLKTNPGKNCGTHWYGGPDLLVEIVSQNDRSREKLAFYSLLGVRELLIVDRDPWGLELYRLEAGELRSVGYSNPESSTQLQSIVLPLNFRLVPGDARPVIEVTHHDGRQAWRI
jgi:Uma2 family endonuclease